MNIQEELGLKTHHILGRGSYATVYYCTKPDSTQAMAVKVFHKKDFTKTKLHYFRKEAEILSSIEHPNIVKFFSFKETSACIYLLMEYIAGGTLKSFMNSKWENHERLNDAQISTIIKSILQGIKYLHKYNIIHRDLKPGMYFKYKLDNILLLDPGDLNSLKIVDFGLSAQLDNNYPKNVKAQCGTLLYMAPEILYEPSYNKGVDIWSCSIIMYQLYNEGQHPIYRQGMKSNEFKQQLRHCLFPALKNQLAQNFIKKISKRDYNERYSVNEALQHPWITRNQYDQIPLSVNQFIHSFTVTDKLADAMKFTFALGSFLPRKIIIPDSYRKKVRDFIKDHEETKARSPSMKKMRTKKKQSLNNARQQSLILSDKIGCNKKDYFIQNNSDILQTSSPLVKKHDHLYSRLFEKQKNSLQNNLSENNVIKVKRCPNPASTLMNESIINIDDSQSSPSPVKSEKQSHNKPPAKKDNDYDSLFDMEIVNFRNSTANDHMSKNINKTKSFKQQSKSSKVDLNFNLMNDKIRMTKKNSFEYRTQSIRSSSKPKKLLQKYDLSTKECILEPMSATTRRSFMSKNKANKDVGKKPMVFGRGGVSYL